MIGFSFVFLFPLFLLTMKTIIIIFILFLSSLTFGQEVKNLISKSELDEILASNKGNVVLFNLWATWCKPCVEEFPDLIKIAAAYDTGKVEVVGISLDYADERESKVMPFVRKNKIPFKIYVAQFGSQDKFINSIQKSWSGAIPATFIYDRHGRQKFSLIGEQTFDRFKYGIDTVLSLK